MWQLTKLGTACSYKSLDSNCFLGAQGFKADLHVEFFDICSYNLVKFSLQSAIVRQNISIVCTTYKVKNVMVWTKRMADLGYCLFLGHQTAIYMQIGEIVLYRRFLIQ